MGITGVSFPTDLGEFRTILLKETYDGAKEGTDLAAESDTFQRGRQVCAIFFASLKKTINHYQLCYRFCYDTSQGMLTCLG